MRDWSSIKRKGGYKTGRGGSKVLPLQKGGGGVEQVLAMWKVGGGGHKQFWCSFSTGA